MTQHMRGLFTALLIGGAATASAQAVSDFDNLPLSQPDTCYIDPNPVGNTVGFTNGDAEFMHNFIDYGGFILWEGFTYSNYTDSIGAGSFDWKFQLSARTAKGYANSEQYATAYAYTPSKIRLKNGALGRPVAGFQLANSTWCYNYVKDNYHTGDWVKLTVKGYLGGALKNDSITYYLADLRAANTASHTNLKTWDWVNLLPLGNVDSLWFRVTSSDDFAPAYFCMDNFTPLVNCTNLTGLAAPTVTATGATVVWHTNSTALSYDYVIDQTAADPTVSGTNTTDTFAVTNNLLALSTYYAHVRSNCGGNARSDWSTVSFTTPALPPATGIDHYQAGNALVTVYPNPAHNELYIKTSLRLNISVYSTDGRLQLKAQATNKLDISQLPQGMYQLLFHDQDGKLRHHMSLAKTL